MPEAAQDRRWLLVLIGYCLFQALARLVSGPFLGLDEAEAMYHARRLALGYGPQPPLYFWLQWVLFQLLGEGLLSLSLLKYALIGGMLVVTYRMLRQAASPAQAGVATLSLALLPQILWESQRDLTHSVLAAFMAVVVLAAGWRALESGRWRDHAVLGLAVGLGVLSKYNVVFMPLGMLAAALSLAPLRARLHWSKLALTLSTALLVLAGPALWAVTNAERAGASLGKLAMDGDAGALATRLRGVGVTLVGTVGFYGLAIVVLLPFVVWAIRRGVRGKADLPLLPRFVARSSVFAIAVVLFMVLLSGSTEVKDRWLLPFAAPLVPVIVLWLLQVLPRRATTLLGTICAALWLLAAVLLPVAGLLVAGHRSADFGPLREGLAKLATEEGVVIATTPWLAGNLVREMPQLGVVLAGEAVPQDAAAIVTSSAPSEAVDAFGLTPAGPATRHEVPVWTRTLTISLVPLVAVD